MPSKLDDGLDTNGTRSNSSRIFSSSSRYLADVDADLGLSFSVESDDTECECAWDVSHCSAFSSASSNSSNP
eukprot:CAMPEP_0184704854 /NCGR_PEP_ID=MMETSP0313-20130426/32491_1 /TAXON_ID=2792 /ORGANISM="Porphyridium aerugineum, Strain SAG 1380-2" /LENGTH=71 /DNA_ID=CAMNT_0027166033 /DNA_START=15 /DNA_END=226 /DNA_ORIENTATION=-